MNMTSLFITSTNRRRKHAKRNGNAKTTETESAKTRTQTTERTNDERRTKERTNNQPSKRRTHKAEENKANFEKSYANRDKRLVECLRGKNEVTDEVVYYSTRTANLQTWCCAAQGNDVDTRRAIGNKGLVRQCCDASWRHGSFTSKVIANKLLKGSKQAISKPASERQSFYHICKPVAYRKTFSCETYWPT
jgi:hypothetical protein